MRSCFVIFSFTFLAVTSLVTSEIRNGKDDALVGNDASSVKHRYKRNVFSLASIVHSLTGKDPYRFVGYGCFCGLGGEGQPLDDIDRCCQAHDSCFDISNTCGGMDTDGVGDPKFLSYAFNCKQDGCHCNDSPNGDTACKKAICECDKQLGLCLKQHADKYDGMNYGARVAGNC